jgi:hypothetical protein
LGPHSKPRFKFFGDANPPARHAAQHVSGARAAPHVRLSLRAIQAAGPLLSTGAVVRRAKQIPRLLLRLLHNRHWMIDSCLFSEAPMKFILQIMVGVAFGGMLIDPAIGLSLAVLFFAAWLIFKIFFIGWLAFRAFERFREAIMTERSLAENGAAELIKSAIAQGKEVVIPYRVKGEIERASVKVTGFDGREILAVDPLSNECCSYSWSRIDADLLIAALAGSLFTLHDSACAPPKPKIAALSLAKRRDARVHFVRACAALSSSRSCLADLQNMSVV